MIARMSLTQLDVDQQKAVVADEGPVLVLAGAGSGKTRVLTERIVHLIYERGFLPQEICALTFTNKAAKEMHGRIVRALEDRGMAIIPHELVISTFHSLALRLIKEYRAVLGYSAGLSIYDTQDQTNLVKDVCKDLGLDTQQLNPKAIAGHFSLAKESVYDNLCEDTVRHFQIFELYQKKLKDNNAVDFSQMLVDWYTLLKNPEAFKQLARRWRYILVDEFQDTNRLQFEILKRMASLHQNIFVVGDEDQSIYKFRGAVIQNILGFDSYMEGTQVIKLTYNYRSTDTILQAAQAVVNQNTFRKSHKEMRAIRDSGDPIRIVTLTSDIEEARDVVGRIGQWMLQGGSLRDIAIFYRTHSVSRVFEDTLRKFNIPYRVFGGMRFYDRAEIKDILAYLRVIVNSNDEIALRRIINVPPRGLGKVALAHVATYAATHSLPLYEVITRHLTNMKLSPKAHGGFTAFKTLIEKFRDWQGKSLSEQVLFLIQESGYQVYLAEDKSPEGQTRVENVQEFINAVADYESFEAHPTLESFLDSLHLDEDVERLSQGEDGAYVSLMTCHAAKGLEFPQVFLVACEEGVFPHIMRDLSDPEELEEERRLFYVAMTRAKQHLYICMSLQRKIMGQYQAQLASRFVSEIPQEYTELIDNTYMAIHPPRQERRIPAQRTPLSNDYAYEYEPEGVDDETGSWVNHATFGKGQIMAVEGEGASKKYRIRFARYGEKRILASFASLTRL